MKKLGLIRLYIRDLFQLCNSPVTKFAEILVILNFGRHWKVYLGKQWLRYAEVSVSRTSVSSKITLWCLSRSYCRTRTIRRSTHSIRLLISTMFIDNFLFALTVTLLHSNDDEWVREIL